MRADGGCRAPERMRKIATPTPVPGPNLASETRHDVVGLGAEQLQQFTLDLTIAERLL
jgi:hypothetical protein